MRWAKGSNGLSRYREVGHLRHGVMSYLWVVAAVSATDAWSIWANPNLLLLPAYSWAGTMAPWWLWMIGFGAVTVGALSALWLDRRKTAPVWLVAVTLTLHGGLCSIIGAAIVLRLLEGTHSYATGASKWLAFTAMAVWMSRQESLFEVDDCSYFEGGRCTLRGPR